MWDSDLPKAPLSWVGKNIVFWMQDPKTAGDIWVLSLEGEKKAHAFANDAADETQAQISPNGKWLAYTSNQTANRNEIYVRAFPSGSGIRQISEGGGDWPRWRGDSQELFYRQRGTGNIPATINVEYSVAISANGSELKVGQPEPVLRLFLLTPPHSVDYLPYDVSPDGKRFLYLRLDRRTNTPAATATIVETSPDPPLGLAVVLNWLSTLKK